MSRTIRSKTEAVDDDCSICSTEDWWIHLNGASSPQSLSASELMSNGSHPERNGTLPDPLLMMTSRIVLYWLRGCCLHNQWPARKSVHIPIYPLQGSLQSMWLSVFRGRSFSESVQLEFGSMAFIEGVLIIDLDGKQNNAPLWLWKLCLST